MLKFILGDASSGKSDMLVKDMVKNSMSFPHEKFFVIVPEQATLQMQQRVVAHLERGATFNIDVVSFDRLAHVVFSDQGIRTDNILDDTGKVLILRRVLDEVKEDLTVYQSKVHLPGFAQRMKSAITELRQYGIDDNGLYLMETCAEEKNNTLLKAKLKDIRLITRRYQEKIRGAYRGAEELLDLFASRVSASKRLKGSHIYLDGFTGFTPVQYKLLTELMKAAKDVTCAFTLPEDKIRNDCPEYDMFYLSNQTFQRLKRAADEAGCETAEPVFSEKKRQQPFVQTFAASGMEEEVTFAAKEILCLVRDKGLRFRDIAVVTSDMESYHQMVESVFAKAKIPCFIDHKSKMTDHPFARFLLSALSLSDQHFSYDAVFGFLKSGLTDLDPDAISLFENYCLEFGIHGKSAFEQEMIKNRKKHGWEKEQEENPDDPSAGFIWDLSEINAVRSAFMESAGEFCRAIGKSGLCAADFVRALKKLFAKNRIEEKLLEKAALFEQAGRRKEKMEYEQIYAKVIGLLDQTEALSGDGTVSAREYLQILESGLSEIKVGVIPPTLDTLVAGDLTRSRLAGIRALFLLGTDESRIPAAAEPSGVFSARDREFLKREQFEMAPTPSENIYNQRFYLYLMMNKPSESLYLTYARSSMDGQEQGPAYLFDTFADFLPDAEMTERKSAADIKWESEALRELASSLRKEPDEALLSFFAAANPSLLSRIADAAFFSNVQNPLDERVALDLYGEVLSGSVSRYEKFSECPFKHFLLYGVRLERRAEYEATAADIGTVYHDALERYSRQLGEEGLSFRDVPEEDSRRIAKESVQKALSDMQSDIWDSTARNEFFVKRITDVTVKTTDVLRRHIRKGLYEPEAYELEFSDTLNDKVRFKGKIDRVDIYEGEDVYVKIIDYKSGNKEFKIADLYNGLQIQLVAYLKEAVKLFGEKNPEKQVVPGGVYYYRINDRFEKDEEAAEKRFQMSGVTSCDEGMLEAVDEDLSPEGPRRSNIVSVSLNKDGAISRYSQVANRNEFAKMLDFTGRKIEEISGQILSGDIDILPYYESEQKNACQYCDYKDVCNFEPGSFGTGWKEKVKKSEKEMEAEIYGRISPE